MNDNELKIKVSETYKREGIYRLVPASQLNLSDDFMNYIPRSKEEKLFWERVKKVTKAGVSDFWRPVCDPSFNDDGCICYEPGNRPALGECHDWWEEKAKKYAPECGSRLGTKSEYIAFLAVLIKELVASDKSVEWAWNAVCNDSKELGDYRKVSISKRSIGDTGNIEICGWYDLANTYKILAEDKEGDGYWFASGSYYDHSYEYPLAGVMFDELCLHDNYFGCGWLVFDSCPDC